MSIWGPVVPVCPEHKGPAWGPGLRKGLDLPSQGSWLLHPEFLASWLGKGPNLSQGSWLSALNSWGSWLCKGPTIHKWSWLSPLNSFQAYCRGVTAMANDLNPVEPDGGQYSLFYKPSSFSPNLHQGLGGILVTGLSHDAQNVHSQIRENNFLITRNIFLKNIFLVLLLHPPCNHTQSFLLAPSSMLLVCYSPGNGFLLSPLPISRMTLLQSLILQVYIFDEWFLSCLIIISFIWGSVHIWKGNEQLPCKTGRTQIILLVT